MRAMLDRGRWRRFAALLALVAAAAAGAPLSVAASSSTPSGVTCRMACCKAKAACCCQGESHARTDRAAERASDAIERPSLQTRCPEGCAQTAAHASGFEAPADGRVLVASLHGPNPPPDARLAPASSHRPSLDIPRAPPVSSHS